MADPSVYVDIENEIRSPDALTIMQAKGSSLDLVRVSVSSAPSTSSHGSAQEDSDAFGDVYVWGETSNALTFRSDILLPRPLESTVTLDALQVSCGVRHSALVTKGGEIFTWGEESGGRLGHGALMDSPYPQLVECLGFTSVDFVACGEFHTCAVTTNRELYTWGDGRHNAGLLGHGNDVSHWIPKRVVLRNLDRLEVAYVSCGTWHTAFITSSGQLFTFGDGTFGALGHGNRENSAYPREVESLKGLKTVSVACGVWHTAAVIEVIVAQPSAGISSGKLFTWGDGDKYRLGHGDKDPRLKPTCIPSLIDYNFQKIACGHSLTVGLTLSGRVFTMGSTVYGQLGNPYSDGKLPCLVEEKLVGESVSAVSCGSYHVAVLTSRGEVYTWGKGANGRLGHGDTEDRKTPTLVEALRDRTVKHIACGSNFSAAICLPKWVSGSEQSQCSSCRQAFGFTRKRHNCYNCGLVHCHACSSRKAFGAMLSPNHNKPYRVCDTCYVKISKISEPKKMLVPPRVSNEKELKLSKSFAGNQDLIKNLDNKAGKNAKKNVLVSSVNTYSVGNSRAVSPFSRKPSPPRSTTPVPTMTGLSVSKNISDSLKKTNELLSHEVLKLRAQVGSLMQRCERQELDLQAATRKAKDAAAMAAEESAKSKAAKEVIKSLTSQLKDIAEKLPYASSYAYNGAEQKSTLETQRRDDSSESSSDLKLNGSHQEQAIDGSALQQKVEADANGVERKRDISPAESDREGGASSKSQSLFPVNSQLQIEAEWIEQYEPGVYITLVALGDGTRDLKRVRFSRRRFGEHQAEAWWSENREKVYQRYNVRRVDRLLP